MKKFRIILGLLFAFTYGVTYAGELPEGWHLSKKSPNVNIKVGTDENVYESAPNSFYLNSISGIGGNINQSLSSKEYLGKRVKITAFLKTENLINATLKGVTYGVQLWSYVYQQARELRQATDGRIQGTNDWKKYTVIFDVPKESSKIVYGLSVTGNGMAWIDTIKFEIVDKSTPLKNSWTPKNY